MRWKMLPWKIQVPRAIHWVSQATGLLLGNSLATCELDIALGNHALYKQPSVYSLICEQIMNNLKFALFPGINCRLLASETSDRWWLGCILITVIMACCLANLSIIQASSRAFATLHLAALRPISETEYFLWNSRVHWKKKYYLI